MKIESRHNPQIKALRALKKRRMRDATKKFLIEGRCEIERALEGGWHLEKLFLCPELSTGPLLPLPTVEITATLFQQMAYRDQSDGLLAVAAMRDHPLSALQRTDVKPLYICAEGVEKPGNLGSILRSCDSAGVDGLIICDPCTDLYNPNVVRASLGTLFTVPIAIASTEEVLHWLRQVGVTLIATSPHATLSYIDVDLTGSVAIAVGSEELGLSAAWMERADLRVRIPMYGKADSLNVAAAATLLAYEGVRQRGNPLRR